MVWQINKLSLGKYLCALTFLTLYISETWSGRIQKCTSLDKNQREVSGRCISFPLCPRLLEMGKNLAKTQDDFRLLSKLTCGFNKDKPLICCPEADIYYPPPADTDYEISYKRPLLFPDNDDDNSQESLNVYPVPSDDNSNLEGSPDVSYAKGRNDGSGLIPNLEDCGGARLDLTSTRIIGGRNAEPSEFPFMALLYRIDTETDEEENYCSATIINSLYLLTAAHCILTNQNTSKRLAYAVVGITDINERCGRNNQTECLFERKHEVKEVIVHPKYVFESRNRQYDIALLRLSLPIQLGERIRPVCLPLANYGFKAPVGPSTGIVAGWGRISNRGTETSTTLKSLIVPIVNLSECQQRYFGLVKLSERQICASGLRGRDTCVGDSGGPLLVPMEDDTENYRYFQAGIVSFGPLICGTSGKPSVYTKVMSHVDWILNNMYM